MSDNWRSGEKVGRVSFLGHLINPCVDFGHSVIRMSQFNVSEEAREFFPDEQRHGSPLKFSREVFKGSASVQGWQVLSSSSRRLRRDRRSGKNRIPIGIGAVPSSSHRHWCTPWNCRRLPIGIGAGTACDVVVIAAAAAAAPQPATAKDDHTAAPVADELSVKPGHECVVAGQQASLRLMGLKWSNTEANVLLPGILINNLATSSSRVITPWDETISRHWRRNVRLGCQCRRRSMKRTTMNFLPVQNLKEFSPRRKGAMMEKCQRAVAKSRRGDKTVETLHKEEDQRRLEEIANAIESSSRVPPMLTWSVNRNYNAKCGC
ncbi:hypothetical protein EJB05_14932, partial [Eragrostis curvula]